MKPGLVWLVEWCKRCTSCDAPFAQCFVSLFDPRPLNCLPSPSLSFSQKHIWDLCEFGGGGQDDNVACDVEVKL